MRFYYFAIIITGIMLLVNMAGFVSPSGTLVKTFNIIDSDGDISFQNFKNSDLWKSESPTNPGLKYILLGAIVGAIVLGAFGRSPDIRYITAGIVFTLTGLLAGDLIWLFVKIQSYGVLWITNLSLLIIGSLTVGLFITALNFWQGND